MAVLTGLNYKEIYELGHWESGRWPYQWETVLTGFSYKRMYGRFAGPEKSDRNNEVTVLTGWP